MIEWILSKITKKNNPIPNRTTIHALPPKSDKNKTEQEDGYVKDCDLGWC